VEIIRNFRHLAYVLHCASRILDNGRFEPRLSILKQAWPSRPREIAIPRSDYATEEDAVDAAHRAGIQWVADFG
jgi:hypothetical protein